VVDGDKFGLCGHGLWSVMGVVGWRWMSHGGGGTWIFFSFFLLKGLIVYGSLCLWVRWMFDCGFSLIVLGLVYVDETIVTVGQ
jgi:hypothetical protein